LRSYIKLLGPPILGGIKALEKVAIDMPEVCMMHRTFAKGLSPHIARDIGLEPQSARLRVPSYDSAMLVEYFRSSGVFVTQERCESIISESGQALGEYDFFFEWHEKPNTSQLTDLITKIDEALADVGCLYSVNTKN
jgi:hypothetical protein